MKKRRVVSLFLIIILMLFPVVALGASGVPQKVLDARSSLVRIQVEIEIDGKRGFGLGTGFVVGDGDQVEYVVTNYHVVEDTSAIIVLQSDTDYTVATPYKLSPAADIAILELDKPIHNIPPAILEDVQLPQAGDPIYAIGYPSAADYTGDFSTAGAEEATITDGIVSKLHEGPTLYNISDVEIIQISAAISGGNSGGPLLNENGHVVGINTFGPEDVSGINFAVNVSELIPLLDSSGVPYTSSSDILAAEKEAQEAAAAEETAEEAAEEAPAAQEAQGLSTIWLIVIIAGALIVMGALIFLLIRSGIGRKGGRSGRSKKAGRNGLPFEVFFGAPHLSAEDKLYALLPMVQQVQKLHADGAYNLDICPQNVTVAQNKASLAVSKGKKADGVVLRPGYSAIEQYSTGKMKGPWTDVYSLCAVVYTALAGSAPQEAHTRAAEPVELPDTLGDKFAPLAETVKNGLALDSRERTTSVEELSVRIQSCLIGYLPGAAQAMQPVASAPQAAAQPTTASPSPVQPITAAPAARADAAATQTESRAKRPSRKRLAIGGIAAVVVVLAVCGLFFAMEIKYSHARDYMDAGEYAIAGETLEGVFGDYGDAAQMKLYAAGQVKLENGEYLAARDIFLEAGGYMDAEEMAAEAAYLYGKKLLDDGSAEEAQAVFAEIEGYKDADTLVVDTLFAEAKALMEGGKADEARVLIDRLVEAGHEQAQDLRDEVDFLEAKRLMEEGKFDEALVIVERLAQSGHTEAEEMYIEINYLVGQYLLEDGKLEEAMIVFAGISGYKDADSLLKKAEDEMYNDAVRMVDEGKFESAARIFRLIPNHMRAEQHLRVCEILPSLLKKDRYDISREEFGELYELGLRVDLSKYLMMDNLIFHFLVGEWDGGDGIYLSMEFDAEEGRFIPDTNLPTNRGGYMGIKDSVWSSYTSEDAEEGKKDFKIVYMNLDTIIINSYVNDFSYSLTRQ